MQYVAAIALALAIIAMCRLAWRTIDRAFEAWDRFLKMNDAHLDAHQARQRPHCNKHKQFQS